MTHNILQSFQDELDTGVGRLPNSAFFHQHESILGENAANIDEDITGWSAVSGSPSLTHYLLQSYRGDGSLRITAPSGLDTSVRSTSFTVAPNHTYTAYGYVSMLDGLTGDLEMSLNFYDASDTLTESYTGQSINLLTEGGWFRISASGAATADSVQARVQVNVSNIGTGDDFLLDYIRVFPTTWVPLQGDLTLSTDFLLTDGMRSPVASLKLTNNQGDGETIEMVSRPFQVDPAVAYRLTAWHRSALSPKTVTVNVNWYAANYSFISSDTETYVDELMSDWTLGSIYLTTPAGARWCTLGWEILNTDLAESHYISELVMAHTDIDIVSGSGIWGLWRWIPEYLKAQDEFQITVDRPFLRYLTAASTSLGEMVTLIDRFYYEPPEDGGASDSTADLVDPHTADTLWLPWLASLVGVRYANLTSGFYTSWNTLFSQLGDGASPLTWQEVVDADEDSDGTEWDEIYQSFSANFDLSTFIRQQIATAVTGWRAGSHLSFIEAAKLSLSGSQDVQIVKRFEGNEWQILVLTYQGETANTDNLMVMLNSVKPAGVLVNHQYQEDYSPTTPPLGSYDEDLPYDEGASYNGAP